MASRAIVHLDIDCFYIQCELLRRPNSDPLRPAAATQKFLVVTCNYPARAAGVTKLMRIDDAKQRCPELLLLPAEDLTPYREASESVFAVLCAFGPTQKLGLDEFFVDLTRAARETCSRCSSAPARAAPRRAASAPRRWAPRCRCRARSCDARFQSNSIT